MAYATNEKFASTGTHTLQQQVEPKAISPKTLAAAAGAPILAVLCPLTFNETTNKWQAWSAKHSEIDTITKSGTVSGGTYTITVNGEVTGAIAYNADAATIQAAIIALGGVLLGDVVVTGAPLNTTPVVLTWGGHFKERAITVSVNPGSLTGGGSAALVQTQVGINTLGFRGFVWPNEAPLDATNDTLTTVMTAGKVHVDALVVPAGETLDNLKAALRTEARPLDFDIQGLDAFR